MSCDSGTVFHLDRFATRSKALRASEAAAAMKAFCYLILLCASPFTLLGQGPVLVTGARVLQAGIYEAQVLATKTNSSGVQLQTLDQFILLQNTTNIPAQLGVRFGFTYQIFGSPSNVPVTLTLVGTHPPMTNSAGKVESVFGYPLKSWIGQSFVSNALDEKSDLVPGVWKFELWYSGKFLCEQSFFVSPDKSRLQQ